MIASAASPSSRFVPAAARVVGAVSLTAGLAAVAIVLLSGWYTGRDAVLLFVSGFLVVVGISLLAQKAVVARVLIFGYVALACCSWLPVELERRAAHRAQMSWEQTRSPQAQETMRSRRLQLMSSEKSKFIIESVALFLVLNAGCSGIVWIVHRRP